MTFLDRRHRRRIIAAAFAVIVCVVPALTGSATGENLSQLQNRFNDVQAQLHGNKQYEHLLSKQISALNGQVSELAGQVSLVQSRETAARDRLARYRARLASARRQAARQRRALKHLRRRLRLARSALARELVSQYEQPQETIVSLILNSTGVQQLIDSVQYLSRVKEHEQTIITTTRSARDTAEAAAVKLSALERSDLTAAGDAETQADALAGMNALLSSRQRALADERAAQSTALAAARLQGSKLRTAVRAIQKQEAAALAATQTVTYSGSGGSGLGPSGGWAIPYQIVLCESGGQDLPPNRAGASGYYQIIPATWHEFGGTGPAAYLAPKSEQDSIATRIWNSGAGASNWACSKIVGIT